MTRLGLYPGTFDPITRGHIDIVQRAARVVDSLIVGVAVHSGKSPLFDTQTRVDQVRRDIAALGLANIEVKPFDGLLVDFARQVRASVIIRGLRAVSDFEYEIQMAAMNYRMEPAIETVFLTATEGTQFIASRFVREIARLGGDVRPFVSEAIAKDLRTVFARAEGRGKVTPEMRD